MSGSSTRRGRLIVRRCLTRALECFNRETLAMFIVVVTLASAQYGAAHLDLPGDFRLRADPAARRLIQGFS
jgi:hypothetical protein